MFSLTVAIRENLFWESVIYNTLLFDIQLYDSVSIVDYYHHIFFFPFVDLILDKCCTLVMRF